MNFEEWWESEERDYDWYLPIIAKAAWINATKVERERCAKICEDMMGNSIDGSSEGYEGGCAARILKGDELLIPHCPVCYAEMVLMMPLPGSYIFDVYTCPNNCKGKQSAIVVK